MVDRRPPSKQRVFHGRKKKGDAVRPLLPKREGGPGTKTRSVVLPIWLWEKLESIAKSSETRGPSGTYSCNAVVRDFLEAAVEEWERQQPDAKERAKK